MEILFSGKDATNLESILFEHSKELKLLDKEIQELFEISNRIHSLALRSVHKVGIVRFNPFKDIGGDQSFALALLDGKDSGLVISSLHTREGTRIYSKPVSKGIAEKYTLTEEEEKAIKEMVELLRVGPKHSIIRDVQVEERKFSDDFKDFKVLRM